MWPVVMLGLTKPKDPGAEVFLPSSLSEPFLELVVAVGDRMADKTDRDSKVKQLKTP